ncbi:MAG: polyprenol monophosphomannose synthase [bacterium]|nr:polyprenol monophosphomannose synthase [bacterium]
MIAVIVPVYNEAENIRSFVAKLRSIVRNALIVMVDDHSPDGTGKIVQSMMKRDKNLLLLPRAGKQGRGSAVWAGMKETLKRPSVDLFLEMDVDGSHNPKDIPRLLDASQRADMVIGSRNLPLSRVEIPLLRRLFSILSNKLTRFLLGVPITDYTNGFRVYRRPVVEYLARFPLTSTGYFALSETAVRAHCAGFRFAEVPITFIDRTKGVSKLSTVEIFGAFVQLFQLARAKAQFPKSRE